MTINVLIVDDEPLAREGLAIRLAQHPDIHIIGECGNGSDAIRMILAEQPDLVFLDIKMPKVSGFDVVKAVGSERMPLVVFLTAYDEFAIEAFKVNALDYLLKPLNSELLLESLNRARQTITKTHIAQRSLQLNALLQQLDNGNLVPPQSPLNQAPLTPNNSPDERLVVRGHGHVHFIKPEDIQWVEADGDYINIHTAQRVHLVRETMQNIEKRLAQHGFQRIHRSIIVKLAIVSELITSDNGDYTVVTSNGTKLKVSRRFRDILFDRLQHNSAP